MKTIAVQFYHCRVDAVKTFSSHSGFSCSLSYIGSRRITPIVESLNPSLVCHYTRVFGVASHRHTNLTHKNTHVSSRHQHCVTSWVSVTKNTHRADSGEPWGCMSVCMCVCQCVCVCVRVSVWGRLCVRVNEAVGGFRACPNSWAIWSSGGKLMIQRGVLTMFLCVSFCFSSLQFFTNSSACMDVREHVFQFLYSVH